MLYGTPPRRRESREGEESGEEHDRGEPGHGGINRPALERYFWRYDALLATPRFLALSKFRVRNGLEAEVRAAFLRRPHLVDGAEGFVRMDVVSPSDDASEFWLLTYWEDEASFRRWHRSHLYRESHAGIPRGLKLVPEATELLTFRYIAD